MLDLPVKKYTAVGPKLVVSRFIVERKEQIVPIQVPRRGITIMRKRIVEAPYDGVVVINGDYYVHPMFEAKLREKVSEIFANYVDQLLMEQLESVQRRMLEGVWNNRTGL